MTSAVSCFSKFILASLLAMSYVHCHTVRNRAPANVQVTANDTAFDWRQKGVIAPVSNQGQIGDANAFVVAEGVESLQAIQNSNQLVILSRQEVADCCDEEFHPKYQGYRCIVLIGGLCTAAAYKPSGGKCDNKTCEAVGKVTGTGYIRANREGLMLEGIHKTPLSAALDASQGSFASYTSGIYSDPICSSSNLDHVVQIVGYGTTAEGQDYWILKNSWDIKPAEVELDIDGENLSKDEIRKAIKLLIYGNPAGPDGITTDAETCYRVRESAIGIKMTSAVSCFSKLILACLLAMSSVHCHTVRVAANATVFDWREKGVIAPVSDQGQIGDSVAFVVAEGVESLHAIQNGNQLVILSRQEVADCCDEDFHPKYQGYKCIVLIGGLCTAAAYKPSGGKCDNKTCEAVGKVTSTGYLQAGSEYLMLEFIHKTPLSAALDASQDSFQSYTSGIYSDPSCSATNLDHVVQIVGYGTTAEGKDYWILKNSWGVSWGENGYMRIARGKNMCGIASNVFFPINDQ